MNTQIRDDIRVNTDRPRDKQTDGKGNRWKVDPLSRCQYRCNNKVLSRPERSSKPVVSSLGACEPESGALTAWPCTCSSKWAAAWQNQQNGMCAQLLSYLLSAQRRLWSDWADVILLGFVVRWLKCSFLSYWMVNRQITSSPKCNDHSPEVPICPKTLCSLSPTPMMLNVKFDQDWPTGLIDIQVQKCEIFVTQGQVTPKWVVWFSLKSNLTKLLCLSWLSATLIMIRSKMNELAWRYHFPIISLWEIF